MAGIRSGVGLPTTPQAAHKSRVAFLETLADLTGCDLALGGALPDGTRPDVLRVDSRRRVVFIGDAKHSESPGNKETQARLLGYLRWILPHVGSGGVGVFAVCFGRESDTDAWIGTLAMLGHEVGLDPKRRGLERFEPGLLVAWSEFGTSSVAGGPCSPSTP